MSESEAQARARRVEAAGAISRMFSTEQWTDLCVALIEHGEKHATQQAEGRIDAVKAWDKRDAERRTAHWKGEHKKALEGLRLTEQGHAALVEVVREFGHDAPVCETLDGATRCFYCRALASGLRVYHSAQCPWPKFRTALAALETP